MAKQILHIYLFHLLDVFTKLSSEAAPTPIVMWHGMGDNCCNPMSMGWIQKYFEDSIPGVYIHSLMIGDTPEEDAANGFLMNVNIQVDIACDKVRDDPKLKNGYHAVGFSQGGLFMRGLAQRCPQPPVFNLISIGAPQQGVYGLPTSLLEYYLLRDYARRLLNYGAYSGWLQSGLVQAQYWHNPLDEPTYREKSIWLADINNDKDIKNNTYKDNLIKLKNLVLIKFSEDSMVDPGESQWFGWYKPGNVETILPLSDSALYKEDWIGLKELDANGRLKFMEVVGDHLQMTDKAYQEIIEKYLKT